MNRCRAFTLLELLLATALAAMMMTLILTFSTRIRSTQATMGLLDTRPEAVSQLERLLLRDLAMAEKVEIGDNTLTLEGYSRLDRSSLDGRQGPTRIGYQLLSVNGHTYLVRQQSELDSRNNQESQVEVLLTGVTQFIMEEPPTEATTQPTPKPPVPQPSARSNKKAAATQPAPGKPRNLLLSVGWEDRTVLPDGKLLMVD